MRVALSRAPHARDLPLPSYATEGASGADLYAAVAADVILRPGERASVPTGIHLAIPAGYEGQVRPRSGLAARLGLGMVNAPGTIDSDYTRRDRRDSHQLGRPAHHPPARGPGRAACHRPRRPRRMGRTWATALCRRRRAARAASDTRACAR